MCGVAGLLAPSLSEEALRSAATRMASAMTHRGPDGRGVMVWPGCALSHARLSILDLSDQGAQPMTSPDGKLAVCYNGEIYNFRELRAELEARGFVFRSRTDTEVLIAGFRAWGLEGLLSRLRGMFAFALRDDTGGQPALYLARDRYGIKPLYYRRLPDGGFAFASETRALEASGLIAGAQDAKGWISFLLFGFVPEPLTTLHDARAVPSGCYARFSADGLRCVRYYDAERLFDRRGGSLDASRLRDCLEETVSLHLISDAPIGVFLSGGVDSSAITALAALGNREVVTVGLHFDDERLSERRFQEIVAQRFGTRHHAIAVRQDDFHRECESFLSALDQPTVDGLNTYMVASQARRAGLKAVLSGLGSDEIFDGYGSNRQAIWLRRLQRLPSALQRRLLHCAPAGARFRRLGYLGRPGQLPLYLARRGLFTPVEVARLLGEAENSAWELLAELESSLQSSAAEAGGMRLDFVFYLRSQLLKDADVLGMAHSLEIRVPFLDHRLVELVLSASSVSGRSRSKAWLTAALSGLLPAPIAGRAKQGFGLPMQEWLKLDRNRVAHEGEHWSRQWALRVMDAVRNRRNRSRQEDRSSRAGVHS